MSSSLFHPPNVLGGGQQTGKHQQHFSNTFAPSAPMEGSLSKWTNVMKGWQFRWFMLDENTGLLSYYTSREKMRRGVRRGCIRLQGAVLGIDDEDDANFTITVDAKVFHLQAKDAEEREVWVRALEEAILRHARLWAGSFKPHLPHQLYTTGGGGLGGTGGGEQQPLARFEQKLAQTDVYLQMLIQQVEALEGRQELGGVVTKANEFLDAVKHSIVLLQIAKNTAFPQTDLSSPVILHYSDPEIQTGIAFGSECRESARSSASTTRAVGGRGSAGVLSSPVRLTTQSPVSPTEKTPVLFSYSSSDDEDFYDAEDFVDDEPDNRSRTSRTSLKSVTESVTESVEEMPKKKKEEGVVSLSGGRSVEIDYDALYEEGLSEEELGSLESHGSVLSHLLSQVKIGMDLTKVALPTFILERRSLLEMYADFFAHPDMFVAIADALTPRDRMVAVIRWYLGAFHAGRKSEVAKKPYNPILGETFQCYWNLPTPTATSTTTRGGKGTECPTGGPTGGPTDGPISERTSSTSQRRSCERTEEEGGGKLLSWVPNPEAVMFLAEQVSHHPPISAFYAEHLDKKISLNAHIWTKSKFLGLSIGVSNIGHAVLSLHSPSREDYTLGFPNGYARSIFTTPWVELGGPVTVSCPQTGYNATVDFKTKPFFSGDKNRVSAQVFGPEDKKRPFLSVDGEWSGSMTGKWSDGRTERFVDVKRLEVIPKRARPIAEQEPFESRRMWKDVTAGLKYKDIEKATEAKFRLEEKQRSEARVRGEKKETWRARMFLPAGDTWIFTHPLEQRLKQRTQSAPHPPENQSPQ